MAEKTGHRALKTYPWSRERGMEEREISMKHLSGFKSKEAEKLDLWKGDACVASVGENNILK